jgi:predicted adenine nucleotide alpha hydrolase (AANH) superfamily ATPase
VKLLMHICCANCSLHPLQTLLLQGIDVRGFWFNPNIHPYTEYTARLESVISLGRLWNLDIAYEDDYALDAFLTSIAGRGPERCAVCYGMRLDRTAEAAKRMHLDGFTTSLLVSPYQKFDIIQDIGHDAGKRHGIAFHAADFRTGWKRAQGLARELDLYRQKYCGCIYSEMERYAKGNKQERT